MEQTGYAFVPPQNLGKYPPTMGTTQEQALRTKRFRQNQVLFRRYTAVDGSIKKAYCNDGATSIPVPTGVPVNIIWTGFHDLYVTSYFYLLRVDRRNRPRRKRGKNDWVLWPRGTSSMTDWIIGKWQRICACRRSYDFWRNDVFQRDHPFDIYLHL